MRSIYALINSAFAGDPITAVEATRILRYMQHQKRVDAWLMRDSSPADRERADGADIGDGFMSYRAMILRDLRKFTVPELRQVVRTQLVMLGMFCELQAASSGGQDRRRRQAVQAARQMQQRDAKSPIVPRHDRGDQGTTSGHHERRRRRPTVSARHRSRFFVGFRGWEAQGRRHHTTHPPGTKTNRSQAALTPVFLSFTPLLCETGRRSFRVTVIQKDGRCVVAKWDWSVV